MAKKRPPRVLPNIAATPRKLPNVSASTASNISVTDSKQHGSNSNNKKIKTEDTRSSSNASSNNKGTELAITMTTNAKPTLAEMFFNGLPSSRIPETNSTATTSHIDTKEDNSIPTTVVACNQKQNIKYESNASEFSSHKDVSSMDKTVVTMVVLDQFFPQVKFADKDFALAWDDNTDSFCQFFISKCNVPVDVDRKEWWLRTRKVITFTMSQTRNDRNTAVKHAFLGKC